ncbi:MAG: CPBP family intramembrane metalloprotease, partial [Planctomycetes bacterium]|nr:CPBP family intramembrane metalloprotease [Planctomycetota bacterium]
AFMILSDGIQELFLRLTGITRPAANEALTGTFGTVPGLVTFLAVALGPGLVEEFWCRGFLGRGLCARYGLICGVLTTSFLFGMLHIDPSHVMIAGLMGAYLHFVYLASRSLWVPVLLHLMNNGLAVFLALTPGLQSAVKAFQDDKQGFRLVMDLASFGLIVFVSVALWTSRAELSSEPITDVDTDTKDWRPEYPGISTPPLESDVKLGYGAVSPAAMLLAMGSFGVLAYLLSQLSS